MKKRSILLLIAIAYCARLDGKLKALRTGNNRMLEAAAEDPVRLMHALGAWRAASTQTFLASLRATAGETADGLRAQGAQARYESVGRVVFACQRAAIQKISKRPVELRLHPGTDLKQERDDPDEKALARCHALVTWSSSLGVKALVEGIPVFYAAPHWICAGAAPR